MKEYKLEVQSGIVKVKCETMCHIMNVLCTLVWKLFQLHE